jgi:plasmid replication initiation protein
MNATALAPVPTPTVVNHLVTQSNRLIEAGHTLTLNEKRMVLACAAKLDPRKPLPENGTVRLSAVDFADTFGIDRRDAYDSLEEASSRLYSRTIKEIRHGTRGKIERNIRWVWMSEYAPGEGFVTLGFSPDVIPYLTMLHKEFTTYELRNVGSLSSFYSIRLYEICAQFKTTGHRELALDRLRDMFDLGDKYADVKNLRVRVIDPAVSDINQHTDLRVVAQPLRSGRKVVGFRFEIEIERQQELFEA